MDTVFQSKGLLVQEADSTVIAHCIHSILSYINVSQAVIMQKMTRLFLKIVIKPNQTTVSSGEKKSICKRCYTREIGGPEPDLSGHGKIRMAPSTNIAIVPNCDNFIGDIGVDY